MNDQDVKDFDEMLEDYMGSRRDKYRSVFLLVGVTIGVLVGLWFFGASF